VTDSNGNGIPKSFCVRPARAVGFTDTLGTIPLLLTSQHQGLQPGELAYNNSSGTQASPFTKSFANYPYRLHLMFEHHRLIPHEFLLLDRLTLPMAHIIITYEKMTPRATRYRRIKSIKLPTGGKFLSVTGGDTNKGVFCLDGSTSGITRTTPTVFGPIVRNNVVVSGGFIASDIRRLPPTRQSDVG